jgi:hypothetical protein
MHKAGAFYIVCAGLVGIALLPPCPAGAAWSTDPAINLAVCTSAGDQGNPAIISDGVGGTIVVWEDSRNGNVDLYAQRLDAAGRSCWPAEGVVVCTATASQRSPRLIADGSGGAFIVWRDERYSSILASTFAQHIGVSGTVLWDANGIRVNTASNSQSTPCIVSDGAGGVIVVWANIGTITLPDPPFYAYVYSYYAQRLDSSGSPQWTSGGVQVVSFSGSDLVAIADGAGGVIFAWSGNPSGSTTDPFNIYAQRVSSAGAMLWGTSGRAVCTASGQQTRPVLVSDGSGGTIIAWGDGRTPSRLSDIYVQRVDASGATRWTGNGVAIATSTSTETSPKIVSDMNGGAIIAWSRLNDTNAVSAYLQRVNSSGAVQWQSGGVFAATAGSFSLLADDVGGVYVTWDQAFNSAGDLYAQRLTSAGARRWAASLKVSGAAGVQATPATALDGLGNMVVAWKDSRSGSGNDIYAQRVEQSGQIGPRCGYQNEIASFTPGPGTAQRDARQSTGGPDGYGTPLGYGGQITLRFPAPITNGAGSDFTVYEIGASSPPAINENYRVEASADGITFVTLGESPGDATSFDLATGGLAQARYVRVTDLPPLEQSGLIDPKNVGADIDAVVSLSCSINEMSCSDGVDNDGDGSTDCGDSDCQRDDDGDGYWPPPCGNDRNDHDASVHPGAVEICDNGVDDNCDGVTDCADAACAWSAFARPYECGDPCSARSDFCADFEWIGGASPDPDRNFDVVIGGDTGMGTAYLTADLRADALQILVDFARVPASSIYGSRISFWLYKRPASVPRTNEEIGSPDFAEFQSLLERLERYNLEYATFRAVPPPGAQFPYGKTIGGRWSLFGPAPASEQSVTALHEMGHGFALRDEYRRAECASAQPFVSGNIVPNVLRDQSDCQAAAAYYASCDVSGDCVRVCDVGRAWRVDVDNLMQAASDCAPCSPLMGYGPLGDLHIRQLVEGIVTTCFTPQRSSQLREIAVAATIPAREARIRLHLESGVAVSAELAIVPDSGRSVIPGGDPVYLQMQDQTGRTLSSLAIWDPAMAEVGGSVADAGTAVRDYRLPHVDSAATWRILNADEVVAFRAGVGAAMFDYCRSVNWTDPQCWLADADGDSIPDVYDNCPSVANRDQLDLNHDGIGDACGTSGVHPAVPTAVSLSTPFPNPTRGRASIRLDLPSETVVRATLYEVSGRMVRRIADRRMPAGSHTLSWGVQDQEGRDMRPGIYFLRVWLGQAAYSRTVIIVR